MRELVRLEMRESNGQVSFYGDTFALIEVAAHAFEKTPSEARMAYLVGVDAREQVAQRAVRHLEPLGPDQRDGHGLAHAADVNDVADDGGARAGIRMKGEGGTRRQRGCR